MPGTFAKLEKDKPSGYVPDGNFSLSKAKGRWVYDPDMDPFTAEEIVPVAPEVDTAWRERAKEVKPLPVVSFSRTIVVDGGLKAASIRLSALGIVDVRVNGSLETSIPRLWPGWTDYNHRVPYARFDLCNISALGTYTLELLLSGGWYAGYLGWERNRGYYGALPAVWAEVVLEYDDGRVDVVGTDFDWIVSDTEWKEADLYMGETVDLRSAFAGRTTRNAKLWSGFVPQMVPANWQPVRIVEEIKPVSIRKDEGVWLVDYGQNHCGVPGFWLAPNAEVVLRFGEILQADGSLYTENYRMARSIDTVMTGGDRYEYRGRFTAHGYRYMTIEGDVGAVEEGSLVSCRLMSDLGRVGSFECDHPRLQVLYDMYIRSSESNLVDISTDCPQRDERLGWTGDGSILAEAHTMTWNMEAFYTKWLTDVVSSQREDGAIPDIVPYVAFKSGIVGWNNAAWSDACILVTHACMKAYGYNDQIRAFWIPWMRYLDSLWAASDNGIRPSSGHGDWLSTEETPKDFIATAYHLASLKAMIEMGDHIGENVAKLRDRVSIASDSFESRWASEIGAFSQTACVLCLKYDLMATHETIVQQRLINSILANKGYLTTGFLGTAHLPAVLSKLNRHDIVMQLFNNDEHPSWGFMLRYGATTFWEHWDSWHPETGYRHPIMNSFNHASLGAFSYWFYNVAGWLGDINVLNMHARITPVDIPGLNDVRVVRQTKHGEFNIRWTRNDVGYAVELHVPPDVVIDWNFKHIPASKLVITYVH
jgi:alpha-L-rhamnosidase